jgi:hypothetical protein
MRYFTVHARRSQGAAGTGDGEFGPFESRTEAERTMASVAASGKYQRVFIKEADDVPAATTLPAKGRKSDA